MSENENRNYAPAFARMRKTDAELYNKHRIAMQKSYIQARAEIGGLGTWDYRDMVFMDCIDGQLKGSFEKDNRDIPQKPRLADLQHQIEEDMEKSWGEGEPKKTEAA